MSSCAIFQKTIDNIIKSIDVYKFLITITNDEKLNMVYIDCLIKLEGNFNDMLKILESNNEK